jgi:hypothetical protein
MSTKSNTPNTPKSPRLTDAQLVILSAAAARDDGMLLPLPASLTLNKGAATLVLESLIRKGLAAERIASLDDETWRLDDIGDRLTLVITDQGLTALGIYQREQDEQENTPQTASEARTDESRSKSTTLTKSTDRNTGSSPKRRKAAPAPKPGSKLAILIDLLERDGGATTPEIMEATGWQPHSVRGAISGSVNKKFGQVVTSLNEDGRGRVYRIAR